MTEPARRRRRWPYVLGGAVVVIVTGFQLQRWFFESPSYDVVAEHGAIEIRRYQPRIVAETTVQADDRQTATREGFRRLAGYIFGDNAKITMTTPVEASPASERIAMTTPVGSRPSADGWVITFTMPSSYRLEDLPRPADERVVLRERAGALVASLRFSGRLRRAEYATRKEELLAALPGAGYRAEGEVGTAVYDPPTTVVGWFRRNEVYVPVAPL